MRLNYIKSLITSGEGINIEFKTSKSRLNKDVFETVCAFLNRLGGHLLLGVKDDGSLLGIDEESIEKIKKEFITSANNPTKINPTFYLGIEEVKIDNKTILYIHIPESSQVHRCNGKIYDRNEDGDIDITNNSNLVAGLYLRKQSTYTENKIFPHAKLESLKSDNFIRVRKLAKNQKTNHPWLFMDNLELLKSAGLYLQDISTGEEGITLGGILLFGEEQLIQAALPHHKTDAILRKENLDRYDDRDDIRVNLIDSHKRLMKFIDKHLNDKFHTEGDQRVSLRDKIFREVVANLLIHREFSNPFPAKLIIEKKRVYIENGNKAHGCGMINPKSFSPFPKNPTIARFFKEIGWADELGSGVRNIYKYNIIYSGVEPTFIEGDIFQTIIPLTSSKKNHLTMQATMQAKILNKEIEKVLKFCQEAKSRAEIQAFLGYKNRDHFRKKILNPLVEGGLLKLTNTNKPTSPNQKYYSKD